MVVSCTWSNELVCDGRKSQYMIFIEDFNHSVRIMRLKDQQASMISILSCISDVFYEILTPDYK